MSSIRCCKTAPTAALEMSVRMQVGALGRGCTSRVALASASLMVWKAVVAASVHVGPLKNPGSQVTWYPRRTCLG